MKKIVFTSLLVAVLSCKNKNSEADAYGNFEATEITVSSEANGKIEFLEVEEGNKIAKNKIVGVIDTTQLHLNKLQLLASIETIFAKSTNVLSQRRVLGEQLKTAKMEQNRILSMYKEGASTKRQVDEIEGKVSVIQQQMKSVETQNAPIVNEVKALEVQIKKMEDQIKKAKIENPVEGTVLTKFAEANEITSYGKPLYKIADLSEMALRVYFSETQLPSVKVGQEVTVSIDENDGMKTYKGKISWISSSAEFTPKIIQTKEERVNLVYAVKVIVKNDGALKIGMPAEVKL
jgi:HlyD family secretion protein